MQWLTRIVLRQLTKYLARFFKVLTEMAHNENTDTKIFERITKDRKKQNYSLKVLVKNMKVFGSSQYFEKKETLANNCEIGKSQKLI